MLHWLLACWPRTVCWLAVTGVAFLIVFIVKALTEVCPW